MRIIYRMKDGSIRSFEADEDTRKNRIYDDGTHYITKLPHEKKLEEKYGEIKNNDVIITNERILHIEERRDSKSFERIMNELRNVIKDCDSIYDDSDGRDNPGILVTKTYDDGKTIMLVVSLSTTCSKNANSVITGIMVGDQTVRRMAKKHKKIV